MENAADALKMAFAAIVFMASISLALVGITQSIEATDIVARSIDVTEFYPEHSYRSVRDAGTLGLTDAGILAIIRRHDEHTIMYITDRRKT
ncbi:MAG: hypothetical protein FWC79_05885 [Oscillospiraceae bacterium]|nr:hypothetical protein [Oscillospiraceae bacterium]